MRVGLGFDMHPLCEGEGIWLGGVKIPCTFGLVGHSDGDVLLHALCDAILGALALGDLGTHFPDTDLAWRGVSSVNLLKEVVTWLTEREQIIENMDAVILVERPPLAPYIQKMRETVASNIHISLEQVSIKAKRLEGLGFFGIKEGIAAWVSVLVKERKVQDG